MAEGGTFQERDAAASNRLSVCQVLNFDLHTVDDDDDDGDNGGGGGEWHRVDTWRARCEFLSTFGMLTEPVKIGCQQVTQESRSSELL